MNELIEQLGEADPTRSVSLPIVTLADVRERAASPLLHVDRRGSFPLRTALVGVAAALLVLGVLGARRVAQPTGSVPSAIVIVFMDPAATNVELAAVGTELALAGIEYRYVDQQGALHEFVRIYRDAPEVTKMVTADALPTSFRLLDTGDGSRPFADVLNALRGFPGVSSVQPASDPAPLGGPVPSPETTSRS